MKKMMIMVFGIMFFAVATATDFKMMNQSSGIIRYAFVRSNRAGIDPIITIPRGKAPTGTTGLGQLWTIWWEVFNQLQGTKKWYYADVRYLKIPVVRLGIPIEMGNDGLLSINGNKVTTVQEIQKPDFF